MLDLLSIVGCWDELCLISGLCPGGGPGRLFHDLDDCLDMIMKDLRDRKVVSEHEDGEIRADLRRILLWFESDGHGKLTQYEKRTLEAPSSFSSYFPSLDQDWDGWNAIAVGTFDKNGESLDVDSNGVRTPPKGYVSCQCLQVP
jgi:hypothetical protein